MFKIISQPTDEPIAVADLKSAMRVDREDEDTLIAEMARTARVYIERRLDLALLPQQWCLRSPVRTDRSYTLRPSNIISVDDATYTTPDGSTHALSSNSFRVCLSQTPPQMRLLPSTALEGGEEISVRFTAGYTAIDQIPAELLRAIYLLTAHYYEERELFRRQRYVPVPISVETLISAYREVRI